ncbi:hypothetical protein Syun_026979 [Stephania yunnanensis]|uniref:SPARK domain-containing protein n=1 Tax=Stephania yunnanensis TaxID=152371 RepID=A0AAP0HKM1_9MAGN
MREGPALKLKYNLLMLFLLMLCLHESNCNPSEYQQDQGSALSESSIEPILPAASPSVEPQPFLPSLAPSPLTPFTNKSVPRLSGLCKLNFSAAESMISITSVDCLANFAPYLANVMCCPQLQATIEVLLGQTSKETGFLALDGTLAKHCLSDVEQILASRGASDDLQHLCSIHPSKLTEASCPIRDVKDFESSVDSSKLLMACEKIDLVNECCTQRCQNAISEAAKKIALSGYGVSSMDGAHNINEQGSRIDDCESIVRRWLALKLELSTSKKVLRGISNCKLNQDCPLTFPDIHHVSTNCGSKANNVTACCISVDKYVSHLQKQSFTTNLQALNCASSLGVKLQKANITKNLYNVCHVSLKDFSLQESGCLLPSLPSDATFDLSSGISFVCDLNDNIAAPWPSTNQLPGSSCNKTTKLPALPAAASGQSGPHGKWPAFTLLFTALLALATLI